MTSIRVMDLDGYIVDLPVADTDGYRFQRPSDLVADYFFRGTGRGGVLKALACVLAINYCDGCYRLTGTIEATRMSWKAAVSVESQHLDRAQVWERKYDEAISAGEDPGSELAAWTWAKVEEARSMMASMSKQVDDLERDMMISNMLDLINIRVVRKRFDPDETAPELHLRAVRRLTGGDVTFGGFITAFLLQEAQSGHAESRLQVTKL